MANLIRGCLLASALGGLLVASAPVGQRAFAAENGVSRAVASRVIDSSQIMVAMADSGKTAYAFSDVTGRWAKINIEGALASPVRPIVASEVAAFVVGTKAYAFGAQSGAWGVVDLGTGAAVPLVSNRVRIEVGSRVFVFTPASHEWAVVDLAKD